MAEPEVAAENGGGDDAKAGAAHFDDFSFYFVIGIWVFYLTPVIIKFINDKPKKWWCLKGRKATTNDT